MARESRNPSVRVIEHEGTRVHVFDFSRAATREEMRERLAGARGALDGEARGGVLTLVDVREAFLDPELVSALGALAVANAPYVQASAVVGAVGALEQARQLIGGMAGRRFEAFGDAKAALDWLVGGDA